MSLANPFSKRAFTDPLGLFGSDKKKDAAATETPPATPLPVTPVTAADSTVVKAEHDYAQEQLLKKSVKKTIYAGDTGGWKAPAMPSGGAAVMAKGGF